MLQFANPMTPPRDMPRVNTLRADTACVDARAANATATNTPAANPPATNSPGHCTPGSLWLDAGVVLFAEGTEGTAAFLVEHGEVEIYLTRDGADVIIARRGAGELIGEIAVIDGGPRSASARAATDCSIIVIPAATLEGRSGASDPVLQMCLALVVNRYRQAMAQVQALTAALPAQVAQPAMAGLPPDPPLVAEGDAFAGATGLLRKEHDLARGLRDGEFVLFFQPIVRLSTRRLAGFEALMRWHHPERGLVAPSSFIPLAEASGMIVDLTAWAVAEIGQVLPQMIDAEHANEAGAERLFLTLNVSAADLLQQSFSDRVCDMLSHAGVPAWRLKIEVTESMIMTDVTRAAAALRVFEQAGVGVAIDDFGTGYSSLSSLATLPISTLKIDRGFVQSMLAEPVQRRVVSTILRLAAELDIPVVGEGIEDEPAADMLAAMHCDYGQGYLFGRPMPQDTMIRSIRSWGRRTPEPAANPVSPAPQRRRLLAPSLL